MSEATKIILDDSVLTIPNNDVKAIVRMGKFARFDLLGSADVVEEYDGKHELGISRLDGGRIAVFSVIKDESVDAPLPDDALKICMFAAKHDYRMMFYSEKGVADFSTMAKERGANVDIVKLDDDPNFYQYEIILKD